MTEPLAQVVVADRRGRPLLRVVGEVDMSNVPVVDEQLRSGAAGAPSVVVDLTELGFLDSQGLRMLQRLADDLAKDGTAVVLVAPPSGIAGSLLTLTGMDLALDVRPSLPD